MHTPYLNTYAGIRWVTLYIAPLLHTSILFYFLPTVRSRSRGADQGPQYVWIWEKRKKEKKKKRKKEKKKREKGKKGKREKREKGKTGKWENGKMGKREKGKKGKRENGKMGKWENGKMGKWEKKPKKKKTAEPFLLVQTLVQPKHETSSPNN